MTENNVNFYHFLGRGGAGKDTQANIAADHLPGSVVISTGDIVRGCKDENNYYHRYFDLLEEYLVGASAGKLVPDDVMIKIVELEVAAKVADGHSEFFFTGFPELQSNR